MTQPDATLHDLPRPPRPEQVQPGQAGAGPRFNPNPLELLPALAQTYGDVVDFSGEENAYLLSNPKDIEFVHVQTGRLFDKGYAQGPALQRLFGNGLVVSEGDFWLRERRMVQPAFHRGRIQGYGEVMVNYAQRLLEGWHDGEVRDVHADMMRVTLDIIVKTLFDVETDERATQFGHAMDGMLGGMAQLYRATSPQEAESAQLRFGEAMARIDRFVADVIAGRRADLGEDGQDGQTDRGDLLSLLLAAQDEAGGGMTDQQLLDESKNLILAGHETTSNTLSWTWWLLSQNPEAEAKLHAELDEVLGGKAPDVDDLPKLPYTKNVIAEAMRILPPVWSVGRRAKQDMQLGGYFVPAGTMLNMSQWVVHRDARWFPDPLAFRPERWEDGLEKQLPKYAYFPFGGGPRVCVGENFARMEAPLLLATIAQRYKLRVLPDQRIELEPSITLRPKYGLKVQLEARV